MSKVTDYHNVKHVVQISTHVGTGCEHCNVSIDDFADRINHYIEKHGYKLLHVGQETGANLQMTVAVLGK